MDEHRRSASDPIRIVCGDPQFAVRLAELAHSPFGRFVVAAGSVDLDAAEPAPGALEGELLVVPDSSASAGLLDAFALDIAVIVVARAEVEAEALFDWLARGAEDVMSTDEWAGHGLPRRLLGAVERKRRERIARTDYATDLETGLPHQRQLIEHMSQLLALREREPAPMAVLALRLEGLASLESQHGREAANVLRRKVAVRLRAGVRASDVVASLGDDSFAVLLGSVLTPADAERVGAKLLRSLHDPFRIGGQDVAIAAALGIGRYPEDGAQPEALLRRATGLAASAQASGRAGYTRLGGDASSSGGAANDER